MQFLTSLVPKVCNTVAVLLFLLILKSVMERFGFAVDQQILAALFVALQIQGGSDGSGSK